MPKFAKTGRGKNKHSENQERAARRRWELDEERRKILKAVNGKLVPGGIEYGDFVSRDGRFYMAFGVPDAVPGNPGSYVLPVVPDNGGVPYDGSLDGRQAIPLPSSLETDIGAVVIALSDVAAISAAQREKRITHVSADGKTTY